MKKLAVTKSLHLLFSAALIAVLTMGMAPAQTARADVMTSTSDLIVTLVSIPKDVRDCEVFEATYTVTNLGPDPATGLFVSVSIPDAFDYTDILGAPNSLAVGETATFTVIFQVVDFGHSYKVQGNYRKLWAAVTVISDPYPDISLDPNPENNRVESQIKIIGPDKSCR
jgi:hypothetical protein